MGGTYITAIRTAMTAALAARAVARPQSKTLAIIGAGAQGEAHLAAFSHLLELTDIRVASRRTRRAAGRVEKYQNALVARSFGRPLLRRHRLLLYRRPRGSGDKRLDRRRDARKFRRVRSGASA
jgi:hypothetical protein